LYLVSGIAGNVLSYALNSNTVSAGESTALLGMFGAFIILRRHFPNDVVLREWTKSYVLLVVINFVFDFFDTSIDIWGHLGGLVGGVLIGTVLAVPKASGKEYNIHERIASGILLVFLLGAFVLLGFKNYNLL
jgi:rhomboid protease GluP